MSQKYFRTYIISVLSLLLLLSLVTSAHSAPPFQGPMRVYRAANFTVNYNPATCQGATTTWPPEAQLALNHTIDILDDLINSTPPIEIDACYENSDDPDTLAAAGPIAAFDQSTVSSLPVANVSYGVALANALSGEDNNGDLSEIDMTVNQAIPWDFSTIVGATPDDKFDFVSTALHELIHGLAFVDSSNVDTNASTGSFGNMVTIYDNFLVDNTGIKLITFDSTQLFNALQGRSGPVLWDGPNAKAANSGARPKIYAPDPYEQGSSIGHLDDQAAENAGRLMRAATGEGPGAHTPSAITLMILKDIGWDINEASDYGDLPAGYAMTTQADDGARHIKNSLFLGAGVTPEDDGPVSDTAAADLNDDGITRSGVWNNGAAGGSVEVTVTGGRGCVSGWIDWNDDNDFSDANEQVAAMQAVNSGPQTISFTVPDNTFSGAGGEKVTLLTRFRLMPDLNGDGDCSVTEQKSLAPQGTIFGGEVEDYQWQFNATGTVIFPPLQRVYLPLVIK